MSESRSEPKKETVTVCKSEEEQSVITGIGQKPISATIEFKQETGQEISDFEKELFISMMKEEIAKDSGFEVDIEVEGTAFQIKILIIFDEIKESSEGLEFLGITMEEIEDLTVRDLVHDSKDRGMSCKVSE